MNWEDSEGCQPLLPSLLVKPEIIRYRFLKGRPNSFEELGKSQSQWSNSNKFVNVDLAAQWPMLIQACPNAAFFSLGIVEQYTKHDKILHFLMSGTAEADLGGLHVVSLSDLMQLQLVGIDKPQQTLSPLIYPNGDLYIPKPLLDYCGDSALSSKVIVHPDGLTSMGTGAKMKCLVSAVQESVLLKNSHKGEKLSMLIPHISGVNNNEAEARIPSSTLKTQSTLTKPLKSPKKVKVKSSPEKKKKASRKRDLNKKNYLYACEILLSFMVDYKHCPKTAILSLKKSGVELPELLTQFSGGIAGTGLAVLICVLCNVASGRVYLCDSMLLDTAFGFGLLWLSWAVYKLRTTIAGIRKNAGKLGLEYKEVIQMLDKNLREIQFRSVAMLAATVLMLA